MPLPKPVFPTALAAFQQQVVYVPPQIGLFACLPHQGWNLHEDRSSVTCIEEAPLTGPLGLVPMHAERHRGTPIWATGF